MVCEMFSKEANYIIKPKERVPLNLLCPLPLILIIFEYSVKIRLFVNFKYNVVQDGMPCKINGQYPCEIVNMQCEMVNIRARWSYAVRDGQYAVRDGQFAVRDG